MVAPPGVASRVTKTVPGVCEAPAPGFNARAAFLWALRRPVLEGRRRRLDVILAKIDPLLSNQQRQEHEHPLVWAHPGVKAEVAGEGPLQDANLIADLEAGTPGELDQPATLARPDLGDDPIANLCRLGTVHDQAP